MKSGSQEVHSRIALALGVYTRDVKVDRVRANTRGTEVHSWGRVLGTRFFAKTLTADPFPLTTPCSIPQGTTFSRSYTRPAAAQVELEWDFMNQFLAAAGPDHICKPLGLSRRAKTIVWEQVGGENMHRLIGRARWEDADGRTSSATLLQSGEWLRKAHSFSQSGSETIDLAELIALLPRSAKELGMRPAGYARYATMGVRFLESALAKMNGTGKITAPVALSHGDFSLSNLIWSPKENRCFVVDFEHAACRPLWHDPVVLISNLRLKLLNPLVPARVIASAERSFWEGYGPASAGFQAVVSTLASAWVLYAALPWFSTAFQRRGWLRGMPASIYGRFLEYYMVPRRLLAQPAAAPQVSAEAVG